MLKSSLAKKAIATVAACSLALGAIALTGCSNSDESTDATANEASSESAETDSASSAAEAEAGEDEAKEIKTTGDMTGVHHAALTVAGYDPITIELDADSAPISVSNFAELVNAGYYDGLAFYRIQDGFVLQGGTLGNTASGSDDTLTPIAGEFAENGYDNALADNFGKGTIAMARTSDMDSATSTFFITLADGSTVSNSLNGLYAAFGTIDEAGMAIIDQIVADYVGNVSESSAMGLISDEASMPIIESIVMVD